MSKNWSKLVLLLLLGSVVVAYNIGYANGYSDRLVDILEPKQPTEEITVEEALDYMARARYSHQAYLDDPDAMLARANKLGYEFEWMKNFHQQVIYRYDAIINLLKDMNY